MNLTTAKKSITAGLAVMAVSFGLAAMAPSSANAGNVDVRIGTHGAAIAIGSRDHRYHGPRRIERRAPAVRHYASCSPREAVSKARRYGVHRAHVDRITRRHVVVEGYKHHRGRVKLAFDRNSRYCSLAWASDRRGGWR